MKKTNIILLFSLLLVPLNIGGQRIPGDYSDGPKFIDITELGRNILITYNMGNINDTKGTPYLFEDFHDGTLYFINRTKLSGLQINYDCTKREILFVWEGNTYSTGRNDIEYFTISRDQAGNDLLFKRILLPRAKEWEYLEILYDTNSFLYKRHLREYREAQNKSPYHVNRDYNEYIIKVEYYLKLAGDDMQLIKPKKNAVIPIFSDYHDDIEEFIKDEKINLKDEEDLIRLVKFYDDLKE